MDDKPTTPASPPKRRLRRAVLVMLVVVVGVFLYIAEMETRVVRGSVNGEAFFRWKPTSYWRNELQGCYYSASGPTRLSIHGPDAPWQWRVQSWLRTLGGPQAQIRFHRWMMQDKVDSVDLILGGHESATSVLAELLEDEERRVRRLAVHGLHVISQKVGPQARRAVPALRRHLNDEDSQVGREADDALRAIDPEAGIE